MSTESHGERPKTAMLRIGDWLVNPSSGEISRPGESARLEVRSMRLLLLLAERAGEVVSIDDLLNQVWAGVTVSQDSVYQAIASLRRQLGDDPRQPTYIATVPRLGYRMIAAVSPVVEPAPVDAPPSRGRRRMLWSLGGLGAALAGGLLIYGKVESNRAAAAAASSAAAEKSIAVLAFLDLTEKMAQEEFADGLSEEVIDKLSQHPGLRVPPPTATFYYKYKKIPIAEIARSLGVVYVLDGSTRKSGSQLRVAARLVRVTNTGESPYVIWSETYDRPWVDPLKIQDEVAGAITQALLAAMDKPPARR